MSILDHLNPVEVKPDPCMLCDKPAGEWVSMWAMPSCVEVAMMALRSGN
jgi:hypothetical protein